MLVLPFLAVLLVLPFSSANGDPRRKLVTLAAASKGLIHLDESTFESLTASDRNWSAAIQFTAMDKRRRCAPCKEFFPSFAAVAKSWTTVPAPERDNHFFATIDFDDTPTVFQKLSLTSAPVVYVYPPTVGPYRPASGKVTPLKYDFGNGFEAAPLAQQLSNHTPVPIPYTAPMDWARMAFFALSVPAVALFLRSAAPVLTNRWTWASLTVIPSLVMTSGYMFVRIRGVPHTGHNGQWVAQGFQNQFGQEVSVISMLYALLGVSILIFVLAIPRQTSPQRQRVQAYVWTIVMLFLYSTLLSLFRSKNRGYPFKIFF